jgi:hypothetical protein
MRELRASMEEKIQVMEAHQSEIDKVNKEIKGLVQSFSSIENASSSLLIAEKESEQSETALHSGRDNDATADIDPNLATASSSTRSSRLRTYARGLAFSIFSHISRPPSWQRIKNPQEGESTSEYEFFSLDEDTYSLMMISRPCSREWFLGIITFLFFQIWLEFLIMQTLPIEHLDTCGIISASRSSGALNNTIVSSDDTISFQDADYDSILIFETIVTCVPFRVPAHKPPSEVTFAQGIALILVLATQSDILKSIHTIISLQRNAHNVPWDKLIGEEGSRSLCLWILRILLPNVAKFIQGAFILFVSFVIIVQSVTIIDLLKALTFLLVVSQADNILFYLAGAGYLGKHLAKRAEEVRTRHIELRSLSDRNTAICRDEESDSSNGTVPRRSFCNIYIIKSVIFGGMCCGMIGGWLWFVQGQYSGRLIRLQYPECNAPYPLDIGDGYCNDYPPYNSLECGYDGFDCPTPNM